MIELVWGKDVWKGSWYLKTLQLILVSKRWPFEGKRNLKLNSRQTIPTSPQVSRLKNIMESNNCRWYAKIIQYRAVAERKQWETYIWDWYFRNTIKRSWQLIENGGRARRERILTLKFQICITGKVFVIMELTKKKRYQLRWALE